MSLFKSRFVLTGPPGIGKTTVVRKVAELLEELFLTVEGFYTEEVKEKNVRVGFDVVTFDGNRCPLARASGDQAGSSSSCRVGKYTVNVKEFELTIVPIFQRIPPSFLGVIIIDEIGKMESFSKAFVKEVESLFNNVNQVILATIPISKASSIPLIESIRNDPKTRLIEVNQSNRDDLHNLLISEITELL